MTKPHAQPLSRAALRRRYPELIEVAISQDGVLSRGQLRSLGWHNARVEHEIEVGRWSAAAPAVVVMHTGPLTWEQRLWVGVLHAGSGDSALSHLTACLRAGLTWLTEDDGVHVVSRKSDDVDPLPGFVFHQSRRPFMDWLSPAEAGPPRIDLEHSALLTAERDRSIRRGIGLLARCAQQGLTTANRLDAASRDICKLRHGAQFRLALGDIAGGAQSFAEIDVGRLCAEAGLMAPRRQVVRLDSQGRRRYLDCEWDLPDGTILVLEIDGGFHMEVDRWWRDMKRERGVRLDGRLVLRCASVEVRLEPWGIVEDLRRAGVPRIGALDRFVRGATA